MLAFTLGYNPWLWLLFCVAVLFVAIVVLCVIIGLIIAWAAARHSDKTIDKYTKDILKLLPCTDCGQCKRCSCEEFADAILHTEIDEDACPHIDEATIDKILAMRERLQKSMEDPTPPKKRGPRFWEQKF